MQRLQRHERIAGGEVLPEVDLANAEKSGKRRADRLPLDGGLDLPDLGVRLLLLGDGPVEFRLGDHAVAQQALHPVVVERAPDRAALRWRPAARAPAACRARPARRPRGPTAGFERDSIDGAGQVRAHRHALHRGHRPDRAQRRRPLLLLRDDRRHRLRRRLKSGALGDGRLNLPELHEAEAREDRGAPPRA